MGSSHLSDSDTFVEHPFKFSEMVLAHRGFWAPHTDLPELLPNSVSSFERAKYYGFGIETDIRDHHGLIVISHDPVQNGENLISIDALREYPFEIALNIKSDGLIPFLDSNSLPQFHFFFDGSIPEMQKYKHRNFNLANRMSDYESSEIKSGKFWMDFFDDPFWWESKGFKFQRDSIYFFVSPELHGLDHLKFWERVKPLFLSESNLRICTDYPLDFVKFLND